MPVYKERWVSCKIMCIHTKIYRVCEGKKSQSGMEHRHLDWLRLVYKFFNLYY